MRIGYLMACGMFAASMAAQASDYDAMQGKWIAVKAYQESRRLDSNATGKIRVFIKGDVFTIDAPGRKHDATIKLGAAPTYNLDVTRVGTDGKPVIFLGTYDLHGGVLTMCWNEQTPMRRPANCEEDSSDTSLTLEKTQ